MKNNHNNFVCHLLTLALAIGLMLAFSTTVQAENNFTITIPSTLEVQKPGWNEISGGITATGTLDAGNALVVTASSDNGFKFVNQSDNTQTISYDFCASSTDLTSLTSWSFEKLSSDATTKTVGINVEDYSSKPYGTYTEKVTFTAEIQTPVDLSKLTADYEAQDGDVLTGTLPVDYKLTVAMGATITLKGVSIEVANNWYGIQPLTDVTIILEGDNTVTNTMEYRPGICIYQGNTLTIRGEGSLTVTGGSQAAAIGLGGNNGCGNIVIEGGTITAKGGPNSPGIGALLSCGSITIGQNVTKVTVTAGDNSTPCIGITNYDDSNKSCGTITIGGTVYYDGSGFKNGGDVKLKAESFTYP